MEKSKKFIKCDIGDFCIRKEEILKDNNKKIVAFAISGIDLINNADFDEKSDEILEKEKNNFEEKIVLYEWECGKFLKVEDIKNQTWFIF